jgi:hypothetical protein
MEQILLIHKQTFEAIQLERVCFRLLPRFRLTLAAGCAVQPLFSTPLIRRLIESFRISVLMS